MDMTPLSYPLPEGSFLTLPPLADQTINILSFFDPQEQQYEIIINRAELNQEQTVDDFLDSQQQKMQRFTPGFTPEEEKIRHQIGPSQLPVLQTANKYLHEGKWIKQISSFITLPYHPYLNPLQRKIIIFTLASHGEFSHSQRQHYLRMINSFTPLQPSSTESDD